MSSDSLEMRDTFPLFIGVPDQRLLFSKKSQKRGKRLKAGGVLWIG